MEKTSFILNIKYNDGSSSVLTTSLPSPSSSAHHHQAPSPQPQPLHRLSRGIKTITDLYRHRYDGLAGGYPVETLERQWGVHWTKDQNERKSSQTGADRSSPPSRTLLSSTTSPSKPLPMSPKKDARSRLNKSFADLAEHNDQIFE